MTDKLLHAVIVPTDAQTAAPSSRSKNIAKRGVLNSDVSATQAIAPEPGATTLTGQYRGTYAPMMARMVEEIFSSSIGVIPFTAVSGEQSQTDGYYAPDQLREVGPVDARESRVQKFSGQLTKVGTRQSHWRAFKTNPQTADNPFGAGSAPEIGLTTAASKVRWFDDSGGGAIEDATPQRTVNGEHGSLDIYDASEPSFGSPVLIYDLALSDEYRTDARIWDTYNRAKTTTTADGTTIDSQWQRVYVTDHEYVGDMILETDQLRLEITQPDETLSAYRWDEGSNDYNSVSLGASDWRIWDVDIDTIGLGRIKGQFEFEDTTNGNKYNLNGTLIRGLDDVVWTVPSNEGATPSGLIDRLDPIADTSDDVVAGSGDVIRRTVVDR